MEGIELLIRKGIGLLIVKGIGLLVMKGIGLVIRKGHKTSPDTLCYLMLNRGGVLPPQ